MNWLLFHGLQRYGKPTLAAQIRSESLERVRKYGFWEYYNPWKNLPVGEASGEYGSNQFSGRRH